MHLYERHYDLVKNMMVTPYFKRAPFKPESLPLLNEPILDETGKILEKYTKFLEPITRGEKPDYSQKTGNDLFDWCFKKLKK
jgi:hypothetical protein